MNKATHIVLIDADFDKALKAANSINAQSFLNADEAMQEIKTSLGVKSRLVGVNIYELDNFRINVNNGSDILSDVFICFINIIE
jgi:indole-3-glycerol phosphate synthase